MPSKSPGLMQKENANGEPSWFWVARRCTRDPRARLYPCKTVNLTSLAPEDRPARCIRLRDELIEWMTGAAPLRVRHTFGTLDDLIDRYLTDPSSDFHDLKEITRKWYTCNLRILRSDHGDKKVEAITGPEIKRWYSRARLPKEPGGPDRIRRATAVIQVLRIVVNFGVTIDYPGAEQLSTKLAVMRFKGPKKRMQRMTLEYVQAFIRQAHRMGYPRMALAQALQFELTLRQGDVIGQWSKLQPGETGIIQKGQRWHGGLTFTAGTVIQIETSKRGVMVEYDLADYPMIMEQIDRIPTAERIGPMIVMENTGRPYRRRWFNVVWRSIAREAGIPDDVWNMDSRAGGITESIDAGASIEHVRVHAQHRNAATTAGYDRPTAAKTSTVARLRTEFRSKEKT